MKNLLLLFVLSFGLMTNAQTHKTVYGFKVTSIDGKEFNFADLKGKKILIVNTASKCGLTPQYKEIEELYKKYGGDKFVVIGFPANNFLSQEPGTDKEIIEFCTKNYGVTFPMMSKISVKGKDQAPVYKWLTSKTENGITDAEVTWNFQKFLINSDGTFFDFISPKTSVNDDKVINWIKNEKH